MFALFALLLASAPPATGQVQISLEEYRRLVAGAEAPPGAPSGHALGQARVTVTVGEAGRAEVSAALSIEVLEDAWTLVPVLPPGSAIDQATVAGAPVALVSTPAGLGWITRASGRHEMVLAYRVDAQRSTAGFALSLPLPRAAATTLTATLRGEGLEPTAIPAVATRVTSSGGTTRLEANVPASGGVQLAWRSAGGRGHALSRARYSGRLEGDAVSWVGELGVDVFGADTATVLLMPRGMTLSLLTVDGREAAVLTEGGRFATLVKGAGAHTIRVGFQTPVLRRDGPPRVDLQLPPVPISRLELTLPGRQELKATPAGSVATRQEGNATVAVVQAPLTEAVSLTWSAAVPEAQKAEVRASAALFHAVHAEEGVLYVHARVQYELSRGASSVLHFLVPPGVQVNRVEAANGAVADWRLAPAAPGRPRLASVFLNREIEGELALDVYYDRSLGAPGEEVELPLLSAPDAHRQRGMVALLATPDLTLDPVDEAAATRVGENQLPPPVREAITRTVAHTFKYADAPPRLAVRARTPDAVAVRFDAQVDTLLSLGDVALSATASVELHVKSGRLAALQLELPADVALLSLSGPSLRTHKATPANGRLLLDVAFTQETEGELRLELAYERLLGQAQAQAVVEAPAVRVPGAEVEQGRVAVEALSAVEVRTSAADNLVTLDVAELPRQLVLRTTHPVLLAYKYVHAEPRPRLALSLTRHRLAGVQDAAIDRAAYRTLVTRDGLQVTAAHFTVRNDRQQFLKLRLPRGAVVWSAQVDGRKEKPALSEEGTVLLLKIVNSTAGFPVQVVYAVQAGGLWPLGSVRATLARPDILATHTRWDVYLPAERSYGEPHSNLDAIEPGRPVTRQEMATGLAGGVEDAPLKIEVPAAGVHLAFEKLYANQAGQEAWLVVRHASAAGAFTGGLLAMLGTLLCWLALALHLRLDPRLPELSPRRLQGLAASGLFLALLFAGYFPAGRTPAAVVSLAVLTAVALAQARRLRSAPIALETR